MKDVLVGLVAVGTPRGGDVYHAGVTMGLGRDQGTHELKWTPTAKRWLQSS